MSSILKALKKLENETSSKSEPGTSPQPFYPKKFTRERVKTERFSNKRRLIILTMLVLLVASGLILTLEPWEKQPTPLPATDLGSELTPVMPTQTKPAAPTLIPKTAPPINDSEKFSPLNKAVKKPSLLVHKFKEKAKLSVKTATGPKETPGVFAQKSASFQPLKENQPTGEKEPAPEQPKDNAQILSIPVKQASASKLELQAIAWSGYPEKRMAVINGHIVREGDLVEGAAVKHIGKNEVVFMKDGEEWRQLFRSAANF